jgi:hypothetical protein
MVDLPLMAKLLDAVPPEARLLLLGDRDQLASVEPGAVFGDICSVAEVAGGLRASGVHQAVRAGSASLVSIRRRPIAGFDDCATAELSLWCRLRHWAAKPKHSSW